MPKNKPKKGRGLTDAEKKLQAAREAEQAARKATREAERAMYAEQPKKFDLCSAIYKLIHQARKMGVPIEEIEHAIAVALWNVGEAETSND